MEIGNRRIDRDTSCFVVAEGGLAHNGKPERAYELIDIAARAGADAVKFQIYRTKELICQDKAPELYKKFLMKEIPYSFFPEFKKYAEEKGLIFFATPHTHSALEFLTEMGVSLFKIGSGEKGSVLFDEILKKEKPTFISTGMRTHVEILDMIDKYGGLNVAFLHCVSMYPTFNDYMNLGFMKSLMRLRDVVIGYSDHSVGDMACLAAVSMGAKIIEKHIKLGSSIGNDVECAMFGKDFSKLVKNIRALEKMIGPSYRRYTGGEKETEKWALKDPETRKRPL